VSGAPAVSAMAAACRRKRVRSRRARPPRRSRSAPPVHAPLAGVSTGMPSPPPHGRWSEWPRASTDAATGGGGGTVLVASGAAGTVGRSGTSAAALLPLPGRARMRGQKAGAGGNLVAARLLRTWRRRVAVMYQCRCALRRTTSVGSPLRGMPLTRVPWRGKGGRLRVLRRRRPRPTLRRSSPPRCPQRPGTPDHPLLRRGRTRPCPAGRTNWWSRPAAGARRAVPRSRARAPAVQVPVRSGVPRRPRAARARKHAPRVTGRGTPTPSVAGGHRTSRPPAAGAGPPSRACRPMRHRVVEGPRHGGSAGGGQSSGRPYPPAGARGCPAPGCRARSPLPYERGTAPGARPTRAVVTSPARAGDYPPVVPGRRPEGRTRRALPLRPVPRPTRPVPPRSRHP